MTQVISVTAHLTSLYNTTKMMTLNQHPCNISRNIKDTFIGGLSYKSLLLWSVSSVHFITAVNNDTSSSQTIQPIYLLCTGQSRLLCKWPKEASKRIMMCILTFNTQLNASRVAGFVTL